MPVTLARQLIEDIATQAAIITTTLLGNTLAVRLIKSPFTPSKDMPPLVAGDEANFNTYVGIDKVAAARPFTYDPATDEVTTDIPAPAGGWHWKTGSTANLPQTIYGYVVTKTAAATPLAGADIVFGALFDTPVVLTATNQDINIAEVMIRYINGGIR